MRGDIFMTVVSPGRFHCIPLQLQFHIQLGKKMYTLNKNVKKKIKEYLSRINIQKQKKDETVNIFLNHCFLLFTKYTASIGIKF